jgi:small subunit ribosomal protein S20
MSNHPSAEKRNRQRIVTTLRNKSALSTMRTAIKAARKAIADGNAAEAKAATASAAKLVAKSAGKGVVHAGNASRTISRLQLALNKLA